MRKIIYFLMFFLVIMGIAFYFIYGKEFVLRLDDNKTYEIKNQNVISIKTLNESKFYNKGILTYNNQKFIYFDYDNNIIRENENRIFTYNVYVADDYIYRCLDNSVEVINNNQSYVITEISGEVINVSREKNRTCIITKQKNGQNSLYMLNENNEVIVENKQFNGMITGVSISDKSEGYFTTKLNYSNGKFINTLTFNLLDDLELWSNVIENEIIIGTKPINNNVLVIGTSNVYLYNHNGSLMWKNSNYNKIKDFEIDEKGEKIYILFEKNMNLEMLCYNYEGKVKEIYKAPHNVKIIKIYGNKIFTYNENIIYLLHDNNSDILYKSNNEQIIDFHVDNGNVYILLKDKLIKGQIS